MRALLSQYLPSAGTTLKSAAVCMYTNTPDEHFLLDFHPQYPQVLLVSPCSGHGFKFSSAIGEIAAQLISGNPPQFDLSPFKAQRLLKT
jgi:glycine/D-amino acid oxidase-like deaminating enzyme